METVYPEMRKISSKSSFPVQISVKHILSGIECVHEQWQTKTKTQYPQTNRVHEGITRHQVSSYRRNRS